MITKLISGLYYILPAISANMAPVFARNIFKGRFNTPIDFNKKFRGKPILGSHKTYRGFVAGLFCAIIIAYFQVRWFINPNIKAISLIDYNEINFLVWGFLMGFGALFGDSMKSFLKRRINVKAGRSWIPFDQIDWLIGVLLFTWWINLPPLDITLILFVSMPLLAIITAHIGYYLKIRKVKF